MSEYASLVQREFKEYSEPHRQMYEIICALLKNKPASLVEIGFGIGWGLQRLVEDNCISKYVGIEPCAASYKYVKGIVDEDHVQLLNRSLLEFEPEESFEFSMCIEVIEHTDEDILQWFKKIRSFTKIASFISTPDKNTDPHGIYTKDYVVDCLKDSGFTSVSKIEWQLPHTIFIAEV